MKNISSNQLCKLFLQEKQFKGTKESTIANYYTLIEKHILPRLPKKARKIKRTIKEQFFELRKFLSNQSCINVIRLTNQILKFAYTEDYIRDAVNIPEPTSTENEITIFTDEEQVILIEYLLSHVSNINFCILLSLLGGCRIGELSALQESEICEEYAKIDFTLQRIKNLDGVSGKTKIVRTKPKSKKSIRKVYLEESVLKQYFKMLTLTNNNFYLTTNSEKYTEPKQLERLFDRILEECHIEHKTFHTLRHTFATNCVRSGIDLKVLADLMGHSDTNVTLKYYIYVDEYIKVKSLDKLTKFLDLTRFLDILKHNSYA